MTVLINLIRASPCGFWCQLSPSLLPSGFWCQLSSFILIVSIPITSWNTNYLMMMLMGFNSWNKLFLILFFFNKFVYPIAIGYLIKTLLSATKRWTSIYISKSFFMISYSCEKNIKKKNREYVEKLLQQVVKSPSIDRICSPSVMFYYYFF